MRKQVDQEIDKLLKSDLIEPVDGPVPWVSLIVTVLKKSGDVKTCVHLRKFNEAVVCEKYPIPTVEEIMHEFNGPTIFTGRAFCRLVWSPSVISV